MPESKNSQLALLASSLCNIGPDTVLLSKNTRMPLNKLRMKYWEYFVSRNLKVQALPNMEKLQLRRVLVIMEVGPGCHPKFFDVMQHIGGILYMTSFSETTIPFVYVAYFTLPSAAEAKIKNCFSRILDRFNVRKASWNSFTWYRRVPMNVCYFDFENSTWGDLPIRVQLPDMKPDEDADEWDDSSNRFDSLDLSIVKHLEFDAAMSANQISRSVTSKFEYAKICDNKRDKLSKVVCYHKANHVIRRKLINGYSIDWTRAAVNTNDIWRPITQYVTISIIIDKLTRDELDTVTFTTSTIPFLWAEASGDGKYFARFHVPCYKVEDIRIKLTTLADSDSLLIELGGRRAVFGLNTSCYDNDAGWMFDEMSVASVIREKTLDACIPSALL